MGRPWTARKVCSGSGVSTRVTHSRTPTPAGPGEYGRQQAARAPAGQGDAVAGRRRRGRPGRRGGARPSTDRPAAGSRGGPAAAAPSGAVPSTSAARVPDVLTTTRSPSSRKRGSSVKCVCTSVPSPVGHQHPHGVAGHAPGLGRRGRLELGGQGERQRVELGQGAGAAARGTASARSCRAPRRRRVRRPGSARSGGRFRSGPARRAPPSRHGSVGDVLAGEGVLVHGGAHVAGVDRPHPRPGSSTASTALRWSRAALEAPYPPQPRRPRRRRPT